MLTKYRFTEQDSGVEQYSQQIIETGF